MSKTITRLFDNYSDGAAAVRELEALGISHDDMSIVANNARGEHAGLKDHGDVERGASTGALIGGAGGLLAGLACWPFRDSARSWRRGGSPRPRQGQASARLAERPRAASSKR